MYIQYSVPKRAHRSILWLLIAALILASLFPALQAARQPVVGRFAHPAAISAGQSLPRPLPVPEPPYRRSAPAARASATPVPPGAQLHPVLQPIPMPPSGQ